METFWHTFYDKLHRAPEDHLVLLIEAPKTPRLTERR